MQFLLLIVFGPAAARLDAPSYPVREQATQFLQKWYPLSIPALAQADLHPSPEVRSRAALVRTRGESIHSSLWRWRMAFVALTPSEHAALVAIRNPDELDGLPLDSIIHYHPPEYIKWHKDISRVREMLNLLPNYTLPADRGIITNDTYVESMILLKLAFFDLISSDGCDIHDHKTMSSLTWRWAFMKAKKKK